MVLNLIQRKVFALSLALIVAFSVFSLSCAEKEEASIVELDDQNFEEFVRFNPFAFVEFYAPWCSHCQQLAPELEQTAQILAEKELPIRLAKIDATQYQDLSDQFQIERYPTLYLFKFSKKIEYFGPHEASVMAEWLEKKMGPISQELTSLDTLQEIVSDSQDPVVVYFGKDAAEAQFTPYLEWAEISSCGLTFYHTFSAEITSAYGVLVEAHKPRLAILKKFEDPIVLYKGVWDGEGFEHFARENRFPVVMPFSMKVAQHIFDEVLDTLFVFVSDDSSHSASQHAEEALERAKSDIQGKVAIVKTTTSSELAQRLTEFLGIDADQALPLVALLDFEEDSYSKYFYDSETEISASGLKEFVEAWQRGDLTPYYKSQEIPATQDEPVVVLVGKSFAKTVLNDADNDVLVEFYAPWCQHCQALEPEYTRLAEYVHSTQKNIIIAKIDATQNEIPGQDIQGYPTILLFRKAQKEEAIEYQGQREFQDLVLFLKENAVNWKEQHEDL